MFRSMLRLVPLVLGITALGVVVACQVVPQRAAPATAEPVQVVEFDASDYFFTAPETLPAGLTTVRLVNQGLEPHHAQLLRMNDGVTFDEFTAALQQEGEGALRLVSAEGGPGAVNPRGASEVTLDLKPGSYALACFIAGPDGVPHLMKGMLKPIQVTGGPVSIAALEVKGTFTLKDFSFDMPGSLSAGRGTYKVVNSGPQMHELNVLKLADGKTVQDALAWENAPAGPPPFAPVGGINAFSKGGSGYMTLDLQPGKYVAVCNVPDPASGLGHVHLGMIKEFTVQS